MISLHLNFLLSISIKQWASHVYPRREFTSGQFSNTSRRQRLCLKEWAFSFQRDRQPLGMGMQKLQSILFGAQFLSVPIGQGSLEPLDGSPKDCWSLFWFHFDFNLSEAQQSGTGEEIPATSTQILWIFGSNNTPSASDLQNIHSFSDYPEFWTLTAITYLLNVFLQGFSRFLFDSDQYDHLHQPEDGGMELCTIQFIHSKLG